MTIILQILIVIASVLLTLVVFAQNPKGGGLSSDFGAAQQIGGVQKTNDFIEKATWILAAFIMVSSIYLTISTKSISSMPEVPEQAQQQQTPGQPAQGQPAE
ncbi:MAG: preprotein translocase subunit SecG [Crocinitomicaceae bacterium]|jgi:preprotein translocase subunit SecG|nr:preprotein translocase subunit SecG [Crocinitomicaceae bacterium]